jgi:peptidoglycan hydrolase CwlO-like protein
LDKGVNVFMIMGKLKSIQKTLTELSTAIENLDGKINDLQGDLSEIKKTVAKALERAP